MTVNSVLSADRATTVNGMMTVGMMKSDDNQIYKTVLVLAAASMKMAVFWVLAPWSLVEAYRRFRGTCCLHHQGDALR
jgi:hypothetical protein